MARVYEKRYRLSESDDVLEKLDRILRDIDQRIDSVELVKEAFQAGNRLDVDALLNKISADIADKSAEMQDLIDETTGGFTPDRIIETVAKRFTSDAELQEIDDAISAANSRIDGRATSAALGAHTGRSDNPHGVTAAQVGTLTTAQIDSDLNMLEALLLGTATGAMDTLGKAEAALNKRVRIDGAQGFTPVQQKQGRSNIGALVSGIAAKAADYAVVAADAGALINVNASGGNRIISLPDLSLVGDGFVIEIKKVDNTFNSVIIQGTIDNVTNKVLRLPNQSVILVSNNTGGPWRILAEGGTSYAGSNVYGDYIRRADGTQECWGRTVVSFTSATGSEVVNLPIAYAANESGGGVFNAFTCLLRDGDTATSSNFENHSGNYAPTSFTLYARNNGGSGAQSRTFAWRTIGRWY